MLLQVEGLKPHDIGLPSIKGSNKLPVVLSKEEMWRLLLCIPGFIKAQDIDRIALWMRVAVQGNSQCSSSRPGFLS